MKMYILLFLPIFFYSQHSSAVEDDIYVPDEHVIILSQESTVSDLKKILNDWPRLKRAIKEYAINSDKKYYRDCDFDGLSIEYIYGIGRFTEENVKMYHSEFFSLMGDYGLRTVETKNPCFLKVDHESISWLFIYKNKKYQVLQTITVL
jgi:hypothetical protein